MARPTGDLRIEVENLKKLRSALKDVGGGLDKELGQAGKKAAAIVAEAAARKVPVRSGRARDSLRSKVSYGGGAVVFGRSSVPYAGWLEFGGAVGRNDSVKRPVVRGGRYIFPSLDEHRGEVLSSYEATVSDIIKRAGLS